MVALKQTLCFFVRQARQARRMPAILFLANFQPMVWMLLFGQLFQSISTIPGFGNGPYVRFLAPGIAIMTALFGSAYAGLGLLGDMHSGVLDYFLASPVRRGALIAGPLLYTGVQTIFQAALILVVALLMGARPTGDIPGVILVLIAAALLGIAFGAISNALALFTRRQQVLIAAVNFLSLPLTFLSSMIMARELMPNWIRTASYINPVDWAVTTARGGFEGTLSGVGWRLGLLATFASLCCVLATAAFRKYQETS